MKHTPKQYARALYDLVERAKPEEAKRIIASFVRLLASRRELSAARRIMRSFEQLLYERQGVRLVDIESAFDLDPKKAKDALGTDAEVRFHIEPRLIGGMRITVGDMRVDNTMRARIKKLKDAIS